MLCQQELDTAASTRLASFDSYLGQRAAEEAAAAKSVFKGAAADFQSQAISSKSDVVTLLAGYSALAPQRKQNTDTIATFFEKAGERLDAVKRILNDGAYDRLGMLDPLPESPSQLVENDISDLEREIEKFNRFTQDNDAVQQRAQRIADLRDRKKLSEEIDLVVEQRNRLEEHHKVTACRAQCRLTGITQQITRRRREILTPSLKDALKEELKVLHLAHIPLDLTDRGDLATSIVEVALSAQQRMVGNSEVLSDGEQRGLALACFLAELKEVGRNHGIIADDPVSSLDHSRMEVVAKRLAQEAANGRQVIVFTHNILFHHMVHTEARRSGAACHEEWMTSVGNTRSGVIDDAQKPWHIKPVTERLNEIHQTRQGLETAEYDPTDETFRASVTDLYMKMRTTWERVVEEILFKRLFSASARRL